MSNRPPRWLIALIVLISLPLLLPFLYVIERAADVGLARSIELLGAQECGNCSVIPYF